MGYILPEIYQSLCQEHDRELPKVFIETGTWLGGVPAKTMYDYGDLVVFDKYYTIELGEKISQRAANKYKLFEEHNCDISKFDPFEDRVDTSFSKQQEYFNGKLTLINGDSTEMLKELLPVIDEPICFWLDAHAGAAKYASGEDDVPLMKELEVISNHHVKNHIIAIDDAHLFGQKQYDANGNMICDYSEITFDKVKSLILDINSNYDVHIYKPYDMEMVLAI